MSEEIKERYLSSGPTDEAWKQSSKHLAAQLFSALGISVKLFPRQDLLGYFNSSEWLKDQEGLCPLCEERKADVALRRRGCQYVNPLANWHVACRSCQEVDDERWKEMWEEYWAGGL